MCDRPVSQIELRWQAVDKLAARFKKHLRPLVTELDFSSLATPSSWLAALRWMKNVLARQQPLAQRPLHEIPEHTIPERLRPYLPELGPDGAAMASWSPAARFGSGTRESSAVLE